MFILVSMSSKIVPTKQLKLTLQKHIYDEAMSSNIFFFQMIEVSNAGAPAVFFNA